MQNFKIKNILITTLFFGIILAFSNVATPKAYAQVPTIPEECRMAERVYNVCKGWYALDVRRTVCNVGVSLLDTLLSSVMGSNLDQLYNCQGFFMAEFASSNLALNDACNASLDAQCASAANVLVYLPGNTVQEKMANKENSGSLLGLLQYAETFTNTEAMPVSLALYVNDSLEDVPVLNSAFAQSPIDYGHGLVNASYDVWKISRNVAYAGMSVVFLYTGIMIILRKKVNQQMVVSIQYALPRIVLAMILIAISYPIGAAITSLAWNLARSLPEILFTQISTTNNQITLGVSTIIIVIFISTLSLVFASPVFLIILLVLFGGLVGMALYVYVKQLIIYMKMVFSIISSPVEFAIGSLPGNEDKIKDWFLRIFKYFLTLSLMQFVIVAGLALDLVFISSSATRETAGLGILMLVASPILVLYYCFGLAIGLEKRIEGFLGIGVKKK